MKRILFFVIIVTMLMFTGQAGAHPAKSVVVTFDAETGVLQVEFSHKVKDNADHFISEITIRLNGEDIITQKLMSQDNADKGSVCYKITDARPGDEISVITKCNKIGSKSEKFIIPE